MVVDWIQVWMVLVCFLVIDELGYGVFVVCQQVVCLWYGQVEVGGQCDDQCQFVVVFQWYLWELLEFIFVVIDVVEWYGGKVEVVILFVGWREWIDQ